MASDAAPHLAAPLRSLDGPAAERASRARDVSSDLEAIFGSGAPTERAAPRANPIPAATRRDGGTEAERSRLTLAGLGGIAAAALAGIAAGSLLVRAPHPPQRPTPAVASAPALPPIAPPPASLPVEMAVPPQALDAAVPAPVAPTPLKAARLTRTHAPRKARTAPACCSYAQVQAADRRLRTAYAVAVRVGVSRGEIAAARDRWSTTRRRAAHDPVRLVATYRDIADDLNRAATRTRAHPARLRRARFEPHSTAWWR